MLYVPRMFFNRGMLHTRRVCNHVSVLPTHQSLSVFMNHTSRNVHHVRAKKIATTNQRGFLKIQNHVLDGSGRANQFFSTMSKVDIKDFTIPNEQPVVNLDCNSAFKNLTGKERLYAHHLSRASFYGGLVVLVQTSLESTPLFSILHQVFSLESIEGLKQKALQDAKLTEEEFKAILVYTCGIYSNMGNYKGMGDSKIIPNLSMEKLEAFLHSTKAFQSHPQLVEEWNQIKGLVYDLSHRKCYLGLGEKGTTTYFSSNCTQEDSEIVNRYFKSINLEGYNNRVFKTSSNGKTHYEIRLASVESGSMSGVTRDVEPFENSLFSVTRGDYAPLLKLVVDELKKAQGFASNEVEVAMLEGYIQSFTTGRLNDHKDGSRHWVKNKGPIIETYIGFIETYRDPAGMRGEFEGFVAVVNREMSAKFGALVAGAETFLTLLPWPSTLEKDKFSKPDFTSLDVLTFSGSGIPVGINIPNYDEVRQDDGFKNVSLGNVLSSRFKDPKHDFIGEEEKKMMSAHAAEVFEVQVGLHELLGHGSGKMLRQNADGTFNFDSASVKASLEADEALSWYEEGETYDSKFTTLGSAYEECRAECVGLYLCLDHGVLKIFGHEGKFADDVIYLNWLMLMLSGIKALERYNPATGVWMQAHSWARYVILQVLLEAGNGLVSITKKVDQDGHDDLLLSVDRTKIATVGKEALGNFLRKLQVYKATGNIAAAQAMFQKYSVVSSDGPNPFAVWRSIVMEKKKPQQVIVQPNTRLQGEIVDLVEYEPTEQGMIQSWNDRLSNESSIHAILKGLFDKERPYFTEN